MKTNFRNYRGEIDKLAMIHLARQFQTDTLHVIDLPYRLSSWALDDPHNVALWEDAAGHLVAWAVLQTPFWTIDYVLSPQLQSELHTQVLAWIDRRAREMLTTPHGHPYWFVNVFANQPERMPALEQFGFTSQVDASEGSWSEIWMERDRSITIPQPVLPDGFSMRSLAGESEVKEYVELHQQVFETKNMTLEWRMRTLQHVDYHADLDVEVFAPGGKMVAFCIGWIAPIPGGGYLGQIEPLGCLGAYRKNILGRAVLYETLKRLQDHGAGRIFVETDSYRNSALRLYERVGFRVSRKVLLYRKDYNHA